MSPQEAIPNGDGAETKSMRSQRNRETSDRRKSEPFQIETISNRGGGDFRALDPKGGGGVGRPRWKHGERRAARHSARDRVCRYGKLPPLRQDE
ncbi:hypothetical protein DFR50_11436 [Roseiarcus fermentans]|uniref:Uncharacterized protein n=1 Tax=Roseiarcus fermentans TaxID=1473586 RepID=A0A366FC77_9HYPH|nr:hypothetical protein DFR50_11436 [Roseiarcus fermentans]